MRRTAHPQRQRAQRACLLHCAQHIGRPPRCGNATQHIFFSKAQRKQFFRAQFARVLRAFYRFAQRPVAAGDKPLHQIRRHVVSGRTLARIEHAQTPACAGSRVKQAASRSHPVHNRIHRGGDAGQCGFNRQRYLPVFPVDDPHHLEGRHAVDLFRCRVGLFGE